ncbi:hypothetical protein RBSH_03377 [Rhodopirellula baltica SH28]|uniref:Uncharacterized protein n=2 Tax=Rhodopirellula baltica TaxID=265606 RepID=Q7UKN3_RHOBA|nr:hypothetical protein RBSH_03377 [Rhodopirellula baltica SH28]CAD76599.1 hypothetical protein RB10044 [Rhodopirellula baltica SH 1]
MSGFELRASLFKSMNNSSSHDVQPWLSQEKARESTRAV